jgi:hypothetical protein
MTKPFVDKFRKREDDRRQKQLQAAFNKGVQARKDGAARMDNPMLSFAWRASWFQGWDHADRQAQEGKSA